MVAIDISPASRAKKRTGVALSAPVVPQSVRGPIRRMKWILVVACLGLYYMLPFIRWDRGPGEPDQAVLMDFSRGRLYAFSIEIWPQELYYLTGLLVLAACVLILLNALAGRVWCGFFCPQTVWTDLFLLVERCIEGDRRDRLKKRDAPVTARRVIELGVKHAAWILISLATGGAVVFYFTDAPTLARDLLNANASLLSLSWIVIFAGLTYTLAGFAREQVCTFMCPWPRLQGAIWDPEALTVNYRDYRGEERLSAKKAIEARANGLPAGDCVDCGQCVAVCPIGIDIREGPNFACINCGLCVDACDGVMKKLDRPRGLIDYDSWTNIERGRRGEAMRRNVLRPKTVGLAVATLALAGTMGVSFAWRSEGSMSVQHDRAPSFVVLSDGSVRNAYTIKLLNRATVERTYSLRVEGLDGAKLDIVGTERDAKVHVAGGEDRTLRVIVTSEFPRNGTLRFFADAGAAGSRFIATDNFVSK
jgi:cytochrome c oxidase accessory protein FixG